MTDKKYCPVPEPVMFGKFAYTFRAYVTLQVDKHPKFQHPTSNTRAGARLLQGLDEMEERGDGVAVWRKEDQKLLHDVVEEDPVPLELTQTNEAGEVVATFVVPNRQLLPFADAIADASSKDPREKGKAPPAPDLPAPDQAAAE